MTPRALSFVAVALLAVGASATSWEWSMTTKERDSFTVKKSAQGGVRIGLDGAFYNILTDDEARSLGRALLEAAGQPEKKYCEECGFKAPYHFQPAELCPPGMTYKCGGVCL